VLIKFIHQGGAGIGSHVLSIDKAEVNTAVPVTTLSAADIVDEWESQSQADPTGFHVNVKEVNGTGQTAGDIAAILAAIKGGSWSTETLKAIYDLVGTRLASAGYTAPPTVSQIRTEMEVDGGKLDHLWETTEDDGGVRRFTTNALEQAPSGGGGGDATEAKQDAIIAALAVVDGNVDSVLEDTGTTLPAQIAALDVGGGTGVYACTWTVTDGTDPLQNATVSFWLNGELKGTGDTDVSGEVAMSLGAATYTVAIVCDGYTFANTTHTVSSTASTWTETFEMTAVSVAAATDPAQTTAYWYVYGNDGALVGVGDVTMTIEIIDVPDDVGYAYDDTPLSLSSSAAGLISATLFKGAKYKVTLSDNREWTVKVPLNAGTTCKMTPIRVVES
jgi:hypothetical protein